MNFIQNKNKPKILIICGPTASGKTSLAIECAKILESSVISADSMSIYRGLDIGTAKPSIDEIKDIKHYMIDIVEPKESFSVSDYKKIVTPIIDNMIKDNKIPIISGGTGFYINSVLFDLSYGNAVSDENIRKKYLDILEQKGNDYLFDCLKKVDYNSSLILHKNDTKRVIRALEIYELTGKPKSQINDKLTPNYDYDAYSIDYDREVLYSRINKRVDCMIENGLIKEVLNLHKNGLNLSFQSMQGIGYKEVLSYLNGEYDKSQMIELIKKNSRNYAKRQITFFKKLDNLVYLKPNDPKILAKNITEKIYDKFRNN